METAHPKRPTTRYGPNAIKLSQREGPDLACKCRPWQKARWKPLSSKPHSWNRCAGPNLGMLPLILTVLDRDYNKGGVTIVPIKGGFQKGGTSQPKP